MLYLQHYTDAVHTEHLLSAVQGRRYKPVPLYQPQEHLLVAPMKRINNFLHYCYSAVSKHFHLFSILQNLQKNAYIIVIVRCSSYKQNQKKAHPNPKHFFTVPSFTNLFCNTSHLATIPCLPLPQNTTNLKSNLIRISPIKNWQVLHWVQTCYKTHRLSQISFH